VNSKPKKLIVFPASMKKVGLLYHFTELGICFSRRIAEKQDYDFLLISEKGELNNGLWSKLEGVLPKREIIRTNTYEEFPQIMETKMAADCYESVTVLTQGLKQFSSLIPLKRKYGKRLKLYIRLNSFKHGSILRYPLTLYYSWVFSRYADYVNFQCAYTATIFARSKTIFDRCLGISIPLGLSKEDSLEPDLDELVPIMKDDSCFKLVYLAQFHKHKRHFELIDQLKELLRNNNRLKLVLLGDGKEFSSIRRMVLEHKLGESVVMPGRIDRRYVPWVLKNVDLSLVLSNVETFGHNILEPLFYGTPVISTDVGIGREVVKDYHTGFLLNSGSLSNLVRYVEYLMNNETALVEMSANAQRLARLEYTWDSVVDRYMRLFDREIGL